MCAFTHLLPMQSKDISLLKCRWHAINLMLIIPVQGGSFLQASMTSQLHIKLMRVKEMMSLLHLHFLENIFLRAQPFCSVSCKISTSRSHVSTKEENTIKCILCSLPVGASKRNLAFVQCLRPELAQQPDIYMQMDRLSSHVVSSTYSWHLMYQGRLKPGCCFSKCQILFLACLLISCANEYFITSHLQGCFQQRMSGHLTLI